MTCQPPTDHHGYPAPHIIPPTSTHTHTIILLHGTSTSGPTFASSLLSFPFSVHDPKSAPNPTTKTLPHLLPSIRFVFPTGKLRTSTVFGGVLKHAWFDITTFADRTVGEDKQIEGLKESCLYLAELVEEEVKLLEGRSDRVVLGGFSQGCAMVSFACLSGALPRVRLGAVVGMSGWLPFRRQIEEVVDSCKDLSGFERRIAVRGYLLDLLGLEASSGEGHSVGEQCLDTELWFGHGLADEKVKPQWALEMSDVMESVGCQRSMKMYDNLGHWYSDAEMRDIFDFLRRMGVGEGEIELAQ
ncbi:hypothetical protein BP6252_03686 [Coleophoma cylindrospora]|uniref:Phospholipase/carboxylesterase/thioesterase domain-containing protein n=1 Tax=Coleophoma cylindrospora TaxID=1849047 RepID=A0A3D8S8Z8_9HELO|nr:hypothetical protein BP6252_03686 [Coleophoma cylindrospora]